MQHIERKLESSFGKKNDLDSRLKSASSSVLTQRIEFKEATQPHSSVTDCLKGKYTNLALPKHVVQKSPSCSDNSGNDGEGLPQPKEIIFKELLNYSWKFHKGAGFTNPFNSCFLNSTLQCLVHTPPLTHYLMSGHHGSQCRVVNREKCILCNLQFLTKRALGGNVDVLSPKWFNNNLQYIGRHFRSGRQEDAHEFLRLSLEKMQKCALIGYNHLDKYSKDTTVINKIFGGYLRSQVICSRCSAKSNTYDPLLDISLDIKTADSIERALHQFVAPERLDHDNAYKCEKCKSKVTATKRFTIHKCPNVLTIQLKRFNYGSSSVIGNKLHKPIKFPMKLDLRSYMSNRNGPPIIYTLFGTIQHLGATCGSGHYLANVRCGEQWFNFNDSVRRLISQNQVLNDTSSAYILFYLRDVDPTQSIMNGPKLHDKETDQSNQSRPKPVNVVSPQRKRPHDIASPRPRIIDTPTGHTKSQNSRNGAPTNDIGQPVKSPFIPLSANREKIRINLGVKPKTPEKQESMAKPSDKSSPTPRLVMKIKDGKSITIETSPDGEKRILSDDDEVIAMMNEKRNKKLSKKPRIVPYPDDSNSDSDWSSNGNSSQRTSTTNTKKDVSRDKSHSKNGVVFDGALNTTTSVPGNAHLFGTVTMKDKVNHNSNPNSERPKDLKMFTPTSSKSGHPSPAKKHFSESLSCVTSPHPAKHSGQGEWHTSVESVLSPSVGSNASSTHSSGSTHENWTVTPGKDKNSVGPPSKSPESASNQTESKKNPEYSSAGVHSSPFNVVSDKESLLTPKKVKDKSSDEYKLYKKMKKKMKKERKRREHIERDHNYTEIGDDSIRHSHKKKKKHKHKNHDEEREDKYYKVKNESEHSAGSGVNRDDGKLKDKYHKEEEVRYKETKQTEDKHHKRRHDRENGDMSVKRSRKDSESSSEFEWVEKTVEKPVPLRTSKSEPVTPCRWDHHVKDSSKRKSLSGSSTPVVTSWDGVKASKVAKELEKVSSYAYGAQVSGWDGNKSHLDTSRENEYSRKRKDSDDEYDDEYDRGKVKKVKQKHHNEYRYNGNLFQQKQNEISRSKIKWSEMKVGDNNPYLKTSQHTEPQHHSYSR